MIWEALLRWLCCVGKAWKISQHRLGGFQMSPSVAHFSEVEGVLSFSKSGHVHCAPSLSSMLNLLRCILCH